MLNLAADAITIQPNLGVYILIEIVKHKKITHLLNEKLYHYGKPHK